MRNTGLQDIAIVIGNNKIELYLGRLSEKGEHIVTFTQKGGKRRYFADCPSLQGVIQKGETISKKKQQQRSTLTRKMYIQNYWLIFCKQNDIETPMLN